MPEAAQKNDSAISADTTSLWLTRRFPFYSCPLAGPAHNVTHSNSSRGAERQRPWLVARSLPSRGSTGARRQGEPSVGIFFFISTCMTGTAEPSRRILAMWTDVGKLVLLHLLLLELRVAKGEGCEGGIVCHVAPGMVDCQRDQVVRHLRRTCDITARWSALCFLISGGTRGTIGGRKALWCLMGLKAARAGMRFSNCNVGLLRSSCSMNVKYNLLS
ncbi:hypothetical protein OJAV_G00032560 [Oryzias javanicus]|uniref:Uncharacterized protein n=1 Tax=Oryzias javanicus TaxID=123683 RepID=A0A437DEX7_ORYJA|nr:hypothetical protein OJAV_G00032560 [Oryzias javanicus]